MRYKTAPNLLAMLALLAAWAASPRAQQAPLVGVYDQSSYAYAITATLDNMGVPWKKLTDQDIKDPARLKPYKVVAMVYGYVFSSTGERNLPPNVQAALGQYVRGGGRLYSEFAAYPGGEVAGSSGWSEGGQPDLEVLTTSHPITKSFKEIKKIAPRIFHICKYIYC